MVSRQGEDKSMGQAQVARVRNLSYLGDLRSEGWQFRPMEKAGWDPTCLPSQRQLESN
jgi:hypothetical protein